MTLDIFSLSKRPTNLFSSLYALVCVLHYFGTMESATNTLNLIELVKNCPQIYDASRSDFKVPLQKDQAWSTIASKLQTTGLYLAASPMLS